MMDNQHFDEDERLLLMIGDDHFSGQSMEFLDPEQKVKDFENQ
jgi:hypothetical protein